MSKNILGTAILGVKGESLETIVLENNDRRLGTINLADKDTGIGNTVFKTLEVEDYCARR